MSLLPNTTISSKCACLLATIATYFAAISLEQLCKLWVAVMLLIAAHLLFRFLTEVKQIVLLAVTSPISMATSTAARWSMTCLWDAVLGSTTAATSSTLTSATASRWGSRWEDFWCWPVLTTLARSAGAKSLPGLHEFFVYVASSALPQLLLLWP
jgi:hypothetical protein